MDNAVEEIKSRLNIVDVVGEYVRLTKAGANWKGLCPFHHEKSPSFMVNEEKQIFHCFGCAKGGDAFTFVMEMESLGFREALKLLADKTGVQLEKYDQRDAGNKNKSFEILELATKFYETQLWNGLGKVNILTYLHGRGLTDESIKQFRLGYAPLGWDNIIKFLTGRGYTVEEIAKTGLLVQKENGGGYYDRFRDRVMFPIHEPLGKVVGYSARVAPGGDESQAKYINTPETENYHKSKALYGIHLAKNEIKQKNFTLLVEGNMDVVASHQAGIKNTVAVSGTALTADQLDTLKRYGESVKMLFDMDSAGQQAAERSADLCFQKGITVDIVTLLEGKDAADVVQKDPQQLLDAVKNSVSAMEYFFQKALKTYAKDKPDDKKAIAGEVLKHVNNFSNEIEKAHWIKKLAQELEVEEKIIIGVLKSVSSNSGDVRRQPSVKEAKPEGSAFKKRSDIIRDKIAGIVMGDAAVWKSSAELYRLKVRMQNDPLLAYVFEQGQHADYSFEKLLLETEDEKKRTYLQKLYFEEKYYFDNSQNVIEYTKAEKEELAAQYIKDFERELQKQHLADIIRDIKIAEQEGDKGKLNTLVGEFTKLSQELK